MAKKPTTPKAPVKQESKKGAAKPQEKKPSGKKSAPKRVGKKKTAKNEAHELRLKTLFACIFIAIVAVIGLIVIISWPTPPSPPTYTSTPIEPPSVPQPEIVTPPVTVTLPPTPQQPIVPPPQRAKVAILMDDLGINYDRGITAINLDIPISVAIIPGEQHATALMEYAHKKQREILIHMPMEPVSYPKNNPGPLGLFISQSDEQVIAATKHLIKLLPFATGGNNHMGSEFTRHADKMELVLTEMKQAQLFFIDSLTISDSIAYQEAQRLGIRSTVRDRFLDNERDVDKISTQLDSLVELAKENGHAIGICHPYPETLIALELFSHQLDTLEIEIVHLEQLVH